MTMRVSMIAPFPPYRGGISQFATSCWNALADAGHVVQGVSFRRQYPRVMTPRRFQYEATPTRTRAPAVRSIDSLGPWTWGRTARTIAEFQPDLIFVHHWSPFFAPAFRAILDRTRRLVPRARSIALVYDAIPETADFVGRRLNRWLLERIDGYVVLSEQVERDLWQLGLRRPVRRIHHPIHDRFGAAPSRAEARDRLGIAPDTPLVLFFGHVRPYKGLDVLLEAVADVRRQLPELRLIVAGEFNEDEKKYRQLMSNLGIARAVDLRNGFVPDEDVATLFAACDVVAQPYLTATHSGVALVAFHFERPVIVTDVGALAEIVPDGEAGLVVEPREPDALADAIHRFFEEGLAARLTEGVRARKAEFSWDRLVEAVEDLAEAT